MRWRKQTREPLDPTWLFSTWPIPRWTGRQCELLVTATDGPEWLQDTADYVYPGPEEQSKLQRLCDRIGSVGGRIDMLQGTFVLADTIRLDGHNGSVIYGNRFIAEGSDD